jgi:hypothetical protein
MIRSEDRRESNRNDLRRRVSVIALLLALFFLVLILILTLILILFLLLPQVLDPDLGNEGRGGEQGEIRSRIKIKKSGRSPFHTRWRMKFM